MGRRECWPQNEQELKQIITSILDNVSKSWFKNAFRSLPDTFMLINHNTPTRIPFQILLQTITGSNW